MKVVFCTPSLTGPTKPYIESLEASIPLIHAAGWEEGYAQVVGCPYISGARADLTRRALNAKADVIVYLDYDLSWRPEDLLKLIETEGDVVCGTYRTKQDDEIYMGTLMCTEDGGMQLRDDGAIKALLMPAGFLKVTNNAIDRFMVGYPDLCYGPKYNLSIDLFQHGAHDRVWWGEDYAFSRRWGGIGGEIWLVPDLSINHHMGEKVFNGNYHKFLLRQPGGSEAE